VVAVIAQGEIDRTEYLQKKQDLGV